MFKKIRTLILILTFIATACFSSMSSTLVKAAGNTYYISTTGNDVTGDGSLTNPWKTVQKSADVMVAGDTCIIRGGTYRETVTPANSGTSGNPMVFKPYTGETVTISGLDVVTGDWIQHSGNIYKSIVALDQDEGNQVFVDGGLMIEARWPNSPSPMFDMTNLAAVDNSTLVDTDTFTITDNAMPDMDWAGGKIWYSPKSHHGWCPWTGDITSYNSSTHTITLDAVIQSTWLNPNKPQTNGQYYLFGKLAALDLEKEWYYDSAYTALYMYKPGGGSPSGNIVEYKKRQYAFNLNGKNYINIEKLNIRGATISTDSSTDHCTIEGITAEYISHYSTGDCTRFARIFDTGIIINGSYNELKNSTVRYSSGNGVLLEGSWNRVVNNLISDVNYMGNYCAGVYLKGDHHIIDHNTITRMARSGISSTLGFLKFTAKAAAKLEFILNVVMNTSTFFGLAKAKILYLYIPKLLFPC